MKLGSTFSKGGEKEEKNNAVEMINFLESRGCAKSSNDQRAQIKQASALTDVLINLAA